MNDRSSAAPSSPSIQTSSVQPAEKTGIQKSTSSATAAASNDNPSSSSGAAPVTTTAATSSNQSSHTGLSTAAAAGVGVGATVGALILAGVLGGWCWRRKARSHKEQHAHDEVPLSPRQLAGARLYGADRDTTRAQREFNLAEHQDILRGDTQGPVGSGGGGGGELEPQPTIPSYYVADKALLTSPPLTKVVYVPAHELPTPSATQRPGFSPTLSGTTPVAPSSMPSELPSCETLVVPRSIYNYQRSRPVTDFSVTTTPTTNTTTNTVSPNTSEMWDVGSQVDTHGRMDAVAQGLMSPLTEELSSDPGPRGHSCSFPAEKSQND